MSRPTYVSTSGTLTQQPLTSRLGYWVRGNLEVAWLFFETLISPVVNPAAWADPSAPRPVATNNRGGNTPGGRGDGSGRGGGGSNSGPSGNRGLGGGTGGFMSMSDLRGGGTVDGCRSTCG